MSTKFYIVMTSGIQGPTAEISEEHAKTISELAARITEPWTGPAHIGMGLSPDHYMVTWDENDDGPIRAVSILSNGWVSMWKRGDMEWHTFTDTVGLWTHLTDIGSAAFQKWTKEIQEAMARRVP